MVADMKGCGVIVCFAIQHQIILDYVNILKDKKLSVSSINRKLVVLEQIYEHLPLPKINPIKGIRLKTELVKALPQPLNYKSLSQYISDFPTETKNFIQSIRPSFPNAENVDYLFISSTGSSNILPTLNRFQVKLKKQIPHLKNFGHWRTSVIIEWLNHQSILQVQSKLGHRFASSTERYKMHKIKTLQEDLFLHHPLK